MVIARLIVPQSAPLYHSKQSDDSPEVSSEQEEKGHHHAIEEEYVLHVEIRRLSQTYK